jgi:hypothetical protein
MKTSSSGVAVFDFSRSHLRAFSLCWRLFATAWAARSKSSAVIIGIFTSFDSHRPASTLGQDAPKKIKRENKSRHSNPYQPPCFNALP